MKQGEAGDSTRLSAPLCKASAQRGGRNGPLNTVTGRMHLKGGKNDENKTQKFI